LLKFKLARISYATLQFRSVDAAFGGKWPVDLLGILFHWLSSSATRRGKKKARGHRRRLCTIGPPLRDISRNKESNRSKGICESIERSSNPEEENGGGSGVTVPAGPPVAAGGGLLVAGGQAPLLRGARGGHHGGILLPHLLLPDAVRARLLRPRLARRRAQRALHRPRPPMEGPLAVVR
jgi:hypothetical protein